MSEEKASYGWNADSVSGLRSKLGETQAAFARRIGVRQQTISEWESGLHTPKGASARMLTVAAEAAARYETMPSPRSKRGSR